MLIDWFTVCAQMVNFLVLVWLLKIFLYKPILKAVADRQNEIAQQLKAAELKKREADEACLLFQVKQKEFDQQKAERVRKLNEEIKLLQDNLREAAQQEVEAQRTKWFSNLQNEKGEVLRELNQNIQAALFSAMRKAMVDLADADLQESLVKAFLQRMETLPQIEKADLAGVLQASPTLQIRTASEVKEMLRTKIQAAIRQEFQGEFKIDFVVLPALIGGIELMANGQKISWNIADYLSSLESEINAAVYQNSEKVHA